MSAELKADSRALDSRRALKMLREACAEEPGEILSLISLRSVKFWPGRRRTVRYRVEIRRPDGSTRERTLYGKLYRGRKGERLHAALFALAPRLDGALRLPRSLGYLPRRRFLVLEEIPGESLASLLLREGGELHLRSFGAALAELHAAEAPSELLPTHDGAAEAAVLEQAGERVLGSALPEDLKSRFARLADGVAESLNSGAGSRGLLHRDLYPEQVLGAGERWGLIDLDELALGEPELDLGNFLAHLELDELRHGGEMDRSGFLRGYEEGGGAPRRDRLDAYRASTLLRLASLERLAGPGLPWERLAKGLLEQVAGSR